MNDVERDIKIAEENLRYRRTDFWPGFIFGALCSAIWVSILWRLS